jgi:hypothetical protein
VRSAQAPDGVHGFAPAEGPKGWPVPGALSGRAVSGKRDRRLAIGRCLVVLLAVGMLSGCESLGQGERPALEAVAQRMPAELAGFQLGDTSRRPGPSLAMDYATPNRGAVGSVLVYDAPTGSAPNDPAAPALDREVTAAVAELAEAPQARTGRRLTERERVTLSELGLRCAVLAGAFGRAPVTRHVCVGAADGRFVKVQVTMTDARPPAADATAFAAAALRAARGG